ncbi:hypothetical protein NDU88_008449 [Pleurodeles waltl]|uniref:Uncharacterized protein n=1 Tax=Pleurodeles waltl TaxID=8319 RepID=A0AAV7P529_PLEWA|nr:hypothetical protein NDU88_008449 [Pleurodeles waltl]
MCSCAHTKTDNSKLAQGRAQCAVPRAATPTMASWTLRQLVAVTGPKKRVAGSLPGLCRLSHADSSARGCVALTRSPPRQRRHRRCKEQRAITGPKKRGLPVPSCPPAAWVSPPVQEEGRRLFPRVLWRGLQQPRCSPGVLGAGSRDAGEVHNVSAKAWLHAGRGAPESLEIKS